MMKTTQMVVFVVIRGFEGRSRNSGEAGSRGRRRRNLWPNPLRAATSADPPLVGILEIASSNLASTDFLSLFGFFFTTRRFLS